jgi:hypothetical protein
VKLCQLSISVQKIAAKRTWGGGIAIYNLEERYYILFPLKYFSEF